MRLLRLTPLDPSCFPLGQLAGELYDNGRKLVLLRPFRFVDAAHGIDVTVPKFATTDFNSTPRIVWSWFPAWEHPEAGSVHDWVYRHPGGLTREHGDQVWRRILELTGASSMKRGMGYRALRWFAGGAWDRYRKADAHA